jgi:molybdenum cofactor biosynthesis enzyme MoaA
MPEEGVKLTKNDKLLTSSEIVSLVNMFTKFGVTKVRFTGGEPLVRKDCVDIIREVGKIEKIKNIAMTTNGILLSKRLSDLKQAGLNQLNISLDTLQEKKFEFIAKRKGWSRVVDSIHHALDIGYSPVKVSITFDLFNLHDFLLNFLIFKVNCVVMKGLNDDEVCDFIEMTRDKVNFY